MIQCYRLMGSGGIVFLRHRKKETKKQMYEYKGRVRYSECDRHGKLSIAGVINYLQDVAILHSEDKMVGVDYLADEEMGWVVTNYTMNIRRFPKLGEEITVRTYPHSMRACVALRSFEMLDEKGERFAEAISTWALMNIKDFKPVKISEEIIAAYQPMICPEFSPEPVKARPQGEEERVGHFTVSEAEIDTNGHMNNGAYARIAEKFLPDGFEFTSCTYVYKKMLFIDEKAEVFTSKTDDGSTQIIFRKDGELSFLAQFK